MRTHRFISGVLVRIGSGFLVSCLLSSLCGLLLMLLLPSQALASPVVDGFSFGVSQGMDRASVSVVRLVVSYGSGASTSPQAGCSMTGLGVIVGSWALSNSSASTPTFTDWVLTDDALVNPGGASCEASASSQALNTIAIYANSAYTGNLSALPLAELQCSGLECKDNGGTTQLIVCQNPSGNTCSAGTLLLPFTSFDPLPFIDIASSAPTTIPTVSESPTTSTAQEVFGIGLTTNSSASSPAQSPTQSLSTPTPLPTGVASTPTAGQALQFLTPFQAIPSTSTNGAFQGEWGMPIVNSNGQFINMNTESAGVGTNILSFVSNQLSPLQNGHTNRLHDAWNQGINDFYGGLRSSVKQDFQPILALNPQFLAPATFLRQTGIQVSGSQGGGLQKSTPKTTPTSSNTNFVNIPLSSLSLTWIALGAFIILVLILLLITIVFLRRRATNRREQREEITRATRRANADAPVIAAQEQAQPAPESSRSTADVAAFANVPAMTAIRQASPELHCPNCGIPVKATDNFCSYCRTPLSNKDAGHPPVSGPLSPPAQMSPVLPLPSSSIADMPTVEMSPTEPRNGQRHENQGSSDAEVTLPFMLERMAGRNVKFVVGTRSDPGIKRKNRPNEDSLFAALGTHSQDQQLQQFGLFVVADGMGGHANGKDASRLSIQTIEDRLVPQLVSNNILQDDDYLRLLIEGVQSANLAVHQRNMEQRADMGTTMTAALVVGTKAYIANVGDSRTYLYREAEGLQKITTDHSVVASLVEAKIINADDIYTHPKRNQIYRSLGEKPNVEVDGFSVQLQPGDKLLLCSDGLWDMTRDPIIQHILKTIPDPEQSRHALIQAAIDGGGEDNISVIVVQVTEDSQQTGINGFRVLAKPEEPQWPPDPAPDPDVT
jgi:serine/threonine protein phosphatase PrpC